MILTVTLNPALDVTYTLDTLTPGASHRVTNVEKRAGGKGVNVARVLRALGQRVIVSGLIGGADGATLTELLDQDNIEHCFTQIMGETRRTVTVVPDDSADVTVLSEPGPTVSPDEWTSLLGDFRRLAARADLAVLSGSLPPGAPDDAYAQLVHAAAESGVEVIVDTAGSALLGACAAGPLAIKPNLDELAQVAPAAANPLEAAHHLHDLGARCVIASLGADGLLALTPDGSWRARLSQPLERGNPTGAGDACVAALAIGLLDRSLWPDILRDATALSAAAVLHPVAGGFDPDAYRTLRTTIDLEDFNAADCHS